MSSSIDHKDPSGNLLRSLNFFDGWDKEPKWLSTKTHKIITYVEDFEAETGHHFNVVLLATWWSDNMQRSCQRHSGILLQATVSPNPACCSGQELQPVARFQPCCLRTTDCCTGFQISFQGRMSMRNSIGSRGPLQLGSRDHNFPKKSLILWAIT